MNFTNKLCLCMTMLASLSSFGMMRHIIRDENGFRVFDGKQEREVRSCFVDPLLKRMSPEQLTTFVEQGNRVRAIRLSNGEHRLQAMVPGKGGGFISGIIAFGVSYLVTEVAILTGAAQAAALAPDVAPAIRAAIPAVATPQGIATVVGAIFTAIPFLP